MSTPLTTRSPAGAPKGGVVVVQEAFGITSYIVDVLQRFAEAGYLAVAPHLFHRTGDPELSYGVMEPVMEQMGQLTADQIDTDVDAALSSLAEAGLEPEQCAIVGFCMGGSVTLQTAVRRRLGAAVTFYGGGVAEGRFGYPSMLAVGDALLTPWLGLFGDLDKGIPTEQVEQLRAVVAGGTVPAEIVRYAEAEHGFHCDARPAVFDADAAADGWERTLAWFADHVAHPGA